MITVSDIFKYINILSPFSLAEKWDNCGLICGDMNKEVSKVMLALDITRDIVKEAIEEKVDLIITHHPAIFDPIKKLTAENNVYQLINHNISLISAHTNLDIADGGVNDVLVELLELQDVTGLSTIDPEEDINLGRIGFLPNDYDAFSLASHIKEKLSAQSISYIDSGKKIKKIAICSGAGACCLQDALIKGADAFLTGELKYSDQLLALDMGLTVIIGGHFETETVILNSLNLQLAKQFSELEINIAKNNRNPLQFI